MYKYSSLGLEGLTINIIMGKIKLTIICILKNQEVTTENHDQFKKMVLIY